LRLEVLRDGVWRELTQYLTQLTHTASSRDMEKLELELFDAVVQAGERLRLLSDAATVFEGVIYEKRTAQEQHLRCTATAYTDLILYERHIVYRSYPVGVSAGEIVRDLASLEDGVDVSGVVDGPSLKSPWEIQNATALEVLLRVAKGTNHMLRMKPGKHLVFRPKTPGTPSATITETDIVSAEYSEDRWRLRNRVVYVGAGGRVLADVGEPPADMPLIVNDPFLTDPDEALRRAVTRLEMGREYGRQLRLRMHRAVFERLGLEAGSTIRLMLPSHGLVNQDLYVVELSYRPGEVYCEVVAGGRLELFEDYLNEALHGDVAALFGQTIQIPELITTIATSVNAALKIQARSRVVRLYNRPPIVMDRAVNIVLDGDGCAALAAGALNGYFETGCMPGNELFTRWLRIHYEAESGGGSVKADILKGDGKTLASNIPDGYEFPYYPQAAGALTEQGAGSWGVEGGELYDVENAAIGFWSVKAVKTAQRMRLYHPRDKALGLDPKNYSSLRLYAYSPNDDPQLKLRLCTDPENYLEAFLTHRGGVWRMYEVSIPTMTRVGEPTEFNYLELETELPSIMLDTDYLLLPAGRERLVVRFTLNRPSASAQSPRVKQVKVVWLEG
jgi:hypothetical protein